MHNDKKGYTNTPYDNCKNCIGTRTILYIYIESVKIKTITIEFSYFNVEFFRILNEEYDIFMIYNAQLIRIKL